MILRMLCALGATFTVAAASAQTVTQADPLLLPPAPGSWTYAPVQGGSQAVFIDSSGRAQITIRCVRATRQVTIVRPVASASSGMQLWTSSGLRQLPAVYDSASASIRASVSVSDPMLDALAFSQGRFAVGALGYAPLVVANWPEPTRAIEDCRN